MKAEIVQGPTSRWFGKNDRVAAHVERAAYARALLSDESRFIFNHAGRRSWKTETAKRALVSRAMDRPAERYLVGGPTNKQTKSVYWADLKALTPPHWVADKSDGDLWLRLRNGSEIHVAGMDAPDRVEGQIWHGALLDEFGNMQARVLDEVILPMIADTKGFLWGIGVPEGRNHYYDLIEAIKRGQWREGAKVFHWHSEDIMDPDEIAAMRAVYDEQMFAQEFGGEFVHFAGRAYYAFDEKIHCGPVKDLYDKRAPLIFCFDFNVDPGVAAVCQERKLPNGLDGTAVIGEVYVPRNSNTEVVSRKLVDDWKDHEGRIAIYGDFTGGARGSAKTQGSDWDIIKRILRPVFGDRLSDKVTVNPPVRDRINAMNGRLKAVNGDVRMMIDPRVAPHIVKDLEGVTLIEGSAGEIDKNSAPQLTHISDALGYYITAEFGYKKHQTLVSHGGRFA